MTYYILTVATAKHKVIHYITTLAQISPTEPKIISASLDIWKLTPPSNSVGRGRGPANIYVERKVCTLNPGTR
jgi:hypothetical protein